MSEGAHEDRVDSPTRGAALGLLAAALFGLSAPVSKQLLASVEPVLLAGLLYSGAAVGLWAQRFLFRRNREAPLRRQDRPALALIVACGGVVAPILMLFGLRRLSALSGSLLLNLEAPFTVLLAVTIFGEHLGRRGFVAVASILLGAASLTLVTSLSDGVGAGVAPDSVDLIGVLLVAAACACWGLDNNLTQKMSVRDPFAIARIKTTTSGIANVLVGVLLLQGDPPSVPYLLGALLLG
jgi:drug/metabolite transporter (DMT)-like permease